MSSGPDEDLERMSLLQHLDELRKRIFRALLVLSGGFVFTWIFREELLRFLRRPIDPLLPEGKGLAFFSVTEPFLLYVKIAALASLFLLAPYLLWELWGFVSPGLYKRERRFAVPFILAGSFFFIAGGAFAYYVAFPHAVSFLLGMGEEFEAVISARTYLGFLTTVILGLAMMFELPILIFLLAWIGVVSPQFLLRHFRWAVLLIFIVAAVITPTPDVVNLCIFAVPTLGLYLLGVGGAYLVYRKPEEEDGEEREQEQGSYAKDK